MQRVCYRCGAAVEDQAAFCSACNAPQVKVATTPEEDNQFPSGPEPEVPPEASFGQPPPPAVSRIQWSLFFRIASPLAALAGFLSVFVFPIGLLVVFPVSLHRNLGRYRTFHPSPLKRAQGALMGAFMALLSFAAFMIFFLATLSLNRGPMIDKIHELAAQNPDPQARQMMLWFATSGGFMVIVGMTLVFFLAIFLGVGAVSGALIARRSKTNPQVT